MATVFIIDEHPVIRDGLASVLEKCAEFQVVGGGGRTAEALPEILALRPDVIIMDAFAGGADTISDVRMIQEKHGSAKIFLLTDSTSEDNFRRAVSAGIKGYFLKDSEVSQLIDAVRLVAADGIVVYSSKLASQFDATTEQSSRAGLLSEREREILSIVAKGHSNKDIAQLCFVSEATVKAHMRRIMEKLDVKNRAEAVSIGIEKGFLKMPARRFNS